MTTSATRKPVPTMLFGKAYHWSDVNGVVDLQHCQDDGSGSCTVCGSAVSR